MEDTCATCFKPLGNEICLFDNKKYHKACCQFCKSKCKPKIREPLAKRPIEPIVVKEKSPKPLIPKTVEEKTPELKKPTKMKIGPGRLNFALFDNLANMEVKCYSCKLTIDGQRFLSKKIGQFNCWDCHYKLAPKCTMCKKIFETNQIIYKDENQLQYCEFCINIHYNELRKQQLNQIQQSRVNISKKNTTASSEVIPNNLVKINIAASSAIMQPQIAKVIRTKSKSKSPSKSPHNSSPTSPLMSPKMKNKKFRTASRSNSNENSETPFLLSSPVEQTAKITVETTYRTTKMCHACSKQLTTKVVSFKGDDYHEKCFTCLSCKKTLSNKLFYEDKQKNQLKCAFLCEKCYLTNRNTKNDNNNNNNKCTICNLRLNKTDSFFIDKYSKVYCIKCFRSVKSKACVKCLKAFQVSNNQSSSVLATSDKTNEELKQLLLEIDKNNNRHLKNNNTSNNQNNNNNFVCYMCD